MGADAVRRQFAERIQPRQRLPFSLAKKRAANRGVFECPRMGAGENAPLPRGF